MLLRTLIIVFLSLISTVSFGAIVNTEKGKIEFTEGHVTPACRTINFIENGTGNSKRFRIGVAADSDVNSVILTALATQNDVQIWYDESITSGCGTEPRIYYIRLYRG